MSVTLRSAMVTGSTGFIGRALVDRLLLEGAEVSCLVRSQSISKAAHFAGDARVRLIEFDLSNLESKLEDSSAEVIFHLASYGVQPNERDVSRLIEGNINILARLLHAAANQPLRRFIHTGSCSEYGYPTPEGVLVPETHPIRPKSLYGAAKASSVLFGNALASYLKVPFVTLRLFGIFGTREQPQRLIPYIISRLRDDRPVDLTGGEQVRDLMFEDDAASAFLAAGTSETLQSGEVYNVCTSQPVRIREVGEFIADVMKKPRDLLRWGERPYRSDEPMWMVGDNRRFQSATALWSPAVKLHEGILRMVDALS